MITGQYYDNVIAQLPTALFYNQPSNYDLQSYTVIQRGKDANNNPIQYDFKNQFQSNSRLLLGKYSTDPSITRPFATGQQMSYQMNSYYTSIYQRFFLYLGIQNTHATEVCNLPQSMSYALAQIGIYQDNNIIGDQIPSDVINFYNQIEIDMSHDVATQKTRQGISSAVQPLLAGQTQYFCIAIPILYYMYFLRSLVTNDKFYIRVTFCNNLVTNQGQTNPLNLVNNVAQPYTITNNDILLKQCDLYFTYIEPPQATLNNILNQPWIDFRQIVPIYQTNQFASVDNITTYQINLTSYKSICGCLAVWALPSTTSLAQQQNYIPIQNVWISSSQNTNIRQSIVQDQFLNQEIINETFPTCQFFKDFKNDIFMINFVLDPKRLIQQQMITGCGQSFKDDTYKINIQFAQASNVQIDVRTIFFTMGFLHCQGGVLTLNKS